MENATKALMIAGAVLIAIMIIGIGMMIYQSAQGTITDAMDNVDQMALSSFNSEFEGYEGTQKGTNVKALISKIITSNTSNEDVPEKVISVVLDGSEETDLPAIRLSIKAGRTYEVKLGYEKGYVHTITITDKSATE